MQMFTIQIIHVETQTKLDEFSAFGQTVEEVLETVKDECNLVLAFKE